MYSTFLPDTPETGIQSVLWTLLAVFFVLTILGWLVASRSWRKEEEAEAHKEHNQDQQAGQL